MALIEASCTKLMGWFAVSCLFLQDVSERSTSKIGQLVPLLLSFLCFQLSHFFFKAAYFLQQRHLVRLARKCAALGGKDYSLQFDHTPLNGGSLLEIEESLGYFRRRLERAYSRGNRTHIRH